MAEGTASGGASGGVPARGPGFPPYICPLAPCFSPSGNTTWVFPEGVQRGRVRRTSGEGGRKARRQGCVGRGSSPGIWIFPRSLPPRPPRPLFSPSANTPLSELEDGGRGPTAGALGGAPSPGAGRPQPSPGPPAAGHGSGDRRRGVRRGGGRGRDRRGGGGAGECGRRTAQRLWGTAPPPASAPRAAPRAPRCPGPWPPRLEVPRCPPVTESPRPPGGGGLTRAAADPRPARLGRSWRSSGPGRGWRCWRRRRRWRRTRRGTTAG